MGRQLAILDRPREGARTAVFETLSFVSMNVLILCPEGDAGNALQGTPHGSLATLNDFVGSEVAGGWQRGISLEHK